MVRRQIALRVAQTFKTRLRNRNLSTTRVIPVGNRGAKECDGAVELDAATANARIEKKKKQVALRKNRSIVSACSRAFELMHAGTGDAEEIRR